MEGFSGQMPFLLLMLVVFFFFIILPQQRRQKKEKNFMKNLAKGDRVITKSGIYAKVMEVNDKVIKIFHLAKWRKFNFKMSPCKNKQKDTTIKKHYNSDGRYDTKSIDTTDTNFQKWVSIPLTLCLDTDTIMWFTKIVF